jgi:hypothetical protein
MHKPALALTLTLSLLGCALEEDPDLAGTEQAITGAVFNAGRAGLLIVSNGDGRVHNGILIAPDIAVTGGVWTRGVSLNRLTVEHGVSLNRPSGDVRRVRQVLYHPDLDVAYMRLETPFGATSVIGLDTRAPASLPSGLRCLGYNASRALREASLNITSRGSQTYTVEDLFGLGHSIADDDDGIPCIDNMSGNATGIAASTNGSVHTQIASAPIAAWLPIAQRLFPIAAQSGRFALYTRTNGNPGSEKCLDIACGLMGDHADVNQYTCHYARNQLWYFDFRTDSQHPLIVSSRSGKCLDIENGTVGSRIQTYECHGGRNQRFAQYLHNPQGSGLAYVSGITQGWSWPINASHTCLSVRGGPSSTNSVTTEARACQTGSTTNFDQRWFLSWR